MEGALRQAGWGHQRFCRADYLRQVPDAVVALVRDCAGGRWETGVPTATLAVAEFSPRTDENVI